MTNWIIGQINVDDIVRNACGHLRQTWRQRGRAYRVAGLQGIRCSSLAKAYATGSLSHVILMTTVFLHTSQKSWAKIHSEKKKALAWNLVSGTEIAEMLVQGHRSDIYALLPLVEWSYWEIQDSLQHFKLHDFAIFEVAIPELLFSMLSKLLIWRLMTEVQSPARPRQLFKTVKKKFHQLKSCNCEI